MHTLTPAPVLLASLLLTAGCVSVTEGTWTIDEPYHTVVFSLDHGDLSVVAQEDADASTEITIHHGGLGWGSAPPEVWDGVLWVDVRCALATCGGSVELLVPAQVDVTGELIYGDAFLSGLGGDVSVTVQAGALEAEGLRGLGRSAQLTAGAGELQANWDARPAWISAATGAGAVALGVPAGRYDLDLDVGAGAVTLAGVADDPTADAAIAVRAGSGEISITGW